MAGTLKEITENYEKLYRLQMIEIILDKMHSYVRDVVSRVEDDFDDCEEFEDYITESIIKNTKSNLETLGKYLGCKSYRELINDVMGKQ
ncbi:MAG: hypothetical protein NC489_29020 [Ruminococcus flavefaciens]|nr:hypothetical protein [Ruminococcus flavefaciens]